MPYRRTREPWLCYHSTPLDLGDYIIPNLKRRFFASVTVETKASTSRGIFLEMSKDVLKSRHIGIVDYLYRFTVYRLFGPHFFPSR